MAEEIVHEGITCDRCGEVPIKGWRYKCNTCPNYDLCPTCNIAGPELHAMGNHQFLEIRKPV